MDNTGQPLLLFAGRPYCAGQAEGPAESWEKAGYEDELWIEAEPFLLWAIEGDAGVAQKLSFHQTDDRMLSLPSITPYREQKLRLLNGSHHRRAHHSVTSPGLNTVYECMQDAYYALLKTVVLDEILYPRSPGLPQAAVFAKAILDRFSNPYIEHKLIQHHLPAKAPK